MHGIPIIEGKEETSDNEASDDDNLSQANAKKKPLKILCTPYL